MISTKLTLVILCILILILILILFYFTNQLKCLRTAYSNNFSTVNYSNDSLKYLIELAKNNNPQFIIYFIDLKPKFLEAFKNLDPNIRNSELTFLAYSYLNFSTKEIANYTYVSNRAVQMRKNRLRKKYNIDSKTHFNEWVREIVDKN